MSYIGKKFSELYWIFEKLILHKFVAVPMLGHDFEMGLYKISWKSGDNWRINRQKTWAKDNCVLD